MSKAAELAALIGSQSALSNRNLVINGAMQVAQRGTSATNAGGGYHTIDRFRFSQNNSGLGNYTTTQSTDVPSGEGFSSSIKITNDNAKTVTNDMSAFITQKIEGQNVQHLKYGTSSAESVTVSFYVRSSVTGTFCCHLFQSGNNRAHVKEYTIFSANTFEKKTLTFTGDTANSLANDNSEELRVSWVLGSGSDYDLSANSWVNATASKGWATSNQTDWIATNGATFYLTGVQLEVGEQATPFEHEDAGTTLQKCQRYYFKFLEGSTKEIGVAWYYTASHASFMFRYPTTMRATPTATDAAGTGYYTIYSNGGSDAINSVAFENGSTEQYSALNNSEASGTAGQAGLVRSTNASAKIEFDAEL